MDKSLINHATPWSELHAMDKTRIARTAGGLSRHHKAEGI
jgi:hypothetical protein